VLKIKGVENKKLCCKYKVMLQIKVVLKIKSSVENKKLIFGGDGTPYYS
jgi:hypothetical protein